MLKKVTVVLALAVASTAALPERASAIAPPTCSGSVLLGFGGYFSGCWGSFQVARYFENAGNVSDMAWFNGMPTRSGTANSPNPLGTVLFNNNCGSPGLPGTGVFCNPNNMQFIGWGFDSELVFGLHNLNSNTWLYSGTDPQRNNPPSPAGIQNWLWQIVGGGLDGWYLFGWEDLNSGCISAQSNSGSNQQPNSTVIDGTMLGASLVKCTSPYVGGNSDNDYNDFYVLVRPYTPDETAQIVPEPLSMTLLATGLLGMGGASAVRRRRNR